ncbi:hypothetical protein D3C75_825290 [compost metagenome]
MVLEFGVAHAQAAARLFQQVGRVGHALHAAGDHHRVGAGLEQVVGQHQRLHPRAAQLVDGGAAGGRGQTGVQRRLAGRSLLEAGGQHAAHDHFLHFGRGDAGALHRGADGGGAQLRRGEGGQAALEAAHRGTGGTDDDDLGHREFLALLDLLLRCTKTDSTPWAAGCKRPSGGWPPNGVAAKSATAAAVSCPIMPTAGQRACRVGPEQPHP